MIYFAISARTMDVRGVHYTWAPNNNNIEVETADL